MPSSDGNVSVAAAARVLSVAVSVLGEQAATEHAAAMTVAVTTREAKRNEIIRQVCDDGRHLSSK